VVATVGLEEARGTWRTFFVCVLLKPWKTDALTVVGVCSAVLEMTKELEYLSIRAPVTGGARKTLLKRVRFTVEHETSVTLTSRVGRVTSAVRVRV